MFHIFLIRFYAQKSWPADYFRSQIDQYQRGNAWNKVKTKKFAAARRSEAEKWLKLLIFYWKRPYLMQILESFFYSLFYKFSREARGFFYTFL